MWTWFSLVDHEQKLEIHSIDQICNNIKILQYNNTLTSQIVQVWYLSWYKKKQHFLPRGPIVWNHCMSTTTSSHCRSLFSPGKCDTYNTATSLLFTETSSKHMRNRVTCVHSHTPLVMCRNWKVIHIKHLRVVVFGTHKPANFCLFIFLKERLSSVHFWAGHLSAAFLINSIKLFSCLQKVSVFVCWYLLSSPSDCHCVYS